MAKKGEKSPGKAKKGGKMARTMQEVMKDTKRIKKCLRKYGKHIFEKTNRDNIKLPGPGLWVEYKCIHCPMRDLRRKRNEKL